MNGLDHRGARSPEGCGEAVLRVVDVHAPVVVGAMVTAPGAVPRDVGCVRVAAGHRRQIMRGKGLLSVVAEFSGQVAPVAAAASSGVGDLVLWPWAQLLPDGLPAREARRRCHAQHEPFAAMAASDPCRLSARRSPRRVAGGRAARARALFERHSRWSAMGNPAETAVAAATLALGGVLQCRPTRAQSFVSTVREVEPR